MACVLSVAVAEPQQRARIGSFNSFNLDQETGSFNLIDELKPTTTPIPILRHVDTQNPDGSYTYGYESGDGTYKIETRYTTGEVKGKYGYYDDTGYLREVEYGAAPDRGFEPRGEGLVVAPPTIADQNRETVTSRPQPSKNTRSRPPQPTQPRFTQRSQPQPAIPQQPAFQARFQPQPAIPQQPAFQAQNRFTPAVPNQPVGPLPSSVSFFNHPYISDYNSVNGVFSYSY